MKSLHWMLFKCHKCFLCGYCICCPPTLDHEACCAWVLHFDTNCNHAITKWQNDSCLCHILCINTITYQDMICPSFVWWELCTCAIWYEISWYVFFQYIWKSRNWIFDITRITHLMSRVQSEHQEEKN